MTTISAVAADVGITLATLYYYFGSKADLYSAVFDDASDRHWASLIEAMEEHDSFVAAVDHLLDTILSSARPEMREFLLNVPIEAKRHAELAPVVERQAAIQQRMVRQIVEPAWARGELDRFESLDDATVALRLLLLGWSLEANFVGEDVQATRTVRALSRGMVSADPDADEVRQSTRRQA